MTVTAGEGSRVGVAAAVGGGVGCGVGAVAPAVVFDVGAVICETVAFDFGVVAGAVIEVPAVAPASEGVAAAMADE
jgi:hypothetical protein